MAWQNEIRKNTKKPLGTKMFEKDFKETKVEVRGTRQYEGFVYATVEWKLELYERNIQASDRAGGESFLSGIQVTPTKITIRGIPLGGKEKAEKEFNEGQIDFDGFNFYAGFASKYGGISPAAVSFEGKDFMKSNRVSISYNPDNTIFKGSLG